jgi:prepilin-type N-terminal cleavage/methylation domain-containing protein
MMFLTTNRNRRRLRTALGSRKMNREGFTLVEIMMVLFILTVGILPLAVIQHRARQEVTQSDLFTQGITVAQDQLERMKGLGFGNAVADTGAVGGVRYASTITNVSFGLDRLEVTVVWQDGLQERSVTLADMISMR